jgi:hypothetical protein
MRSRHNQRAPGQGFPAEKISHRGFLGAALENPWPLPWGVDQRAHDQLIILQQAGGQGKDLGPKRSDHKDSSALFSYRSPRGMVQKQN